MSPTRRLLAIAARGDLTKVEMVALLEKEAAAVERRLFVVGANLALALNGKSMGPRTKRWLEQAAKALEEL